MSDASYIIYLLQHSLVIVLGLVIVQMNLPTSLAMLLLMPSVFLITFLIHLFIVQKVTWLRYLLNAR